jgi:predicted phage baseplate assembly protein
VNVPLEAPVLDDRRFADLVAEARTRIPRYTPEWTDLNDNDPGMALVQLFAWMTEAVLFRLARVPDLHYIKFLQLLGIELRPAEPAHVDVAFPLLENQPEAVVTVPKGTQITAAGEEPVVFETDAALLAVAARLAQIQVFDGAEYTVFPPPKGDDGEEPFPAFGAYAPAGSALLLGFGYPDKYPGNTEVFPRTQLSLTFFAHGDPQRRETVTCGLPRAQAFPSAKLVWEYRGARDWQPMTVDGDTTLALACSGRVLLRTPAPGMMRRGKIGKSTDDLFWVRARVDRPGYERPPLLDAVLTNTVGATQAQTQRDEVLGGSDGRPNQVFRLARAPVLNDTLVLEVDEGDGDGFQRWTEVRDFFASKRDDLHFVLDRTSGEVRFGDGEFGRIPVGNLANPDANVVARVYRTGGGKKGNVPPGMLRNLPGVVPGVDSSAVRNFRAALGARDEETLEEGKRRAPQALKNKCRAVTAEDFEALAQDVPGVRRARALPLTHPAFPGQSVPGAVSVIIVPDSDAPAPMPSEGLLQTVCAYLDPRRLLTAELHVLAPTYYQVRVRASVIARRDADLGEVRQAVEARLLAYFHPLHGGEDGTGWEFGGKVFFSLVYRQVLGVAGVGRIGQMTIELDGVEQPACQDVAIESGSLAFSTEHEIVATYEGDSE